MKISPNFTAYEMVRSRDFPALQTEWADIGSDGAAKISRVVIEFLQPLRDRFGPIAVLSGHRSRALNAAVGGASASRHLRSLAADFKPEADALRVWRWIVEQRDLGVVNFDRLTIYTTVSPVTFHVDLREWEQGEQRRRLFRGSPWKELTVDEALAVELPGV